MSTLLLYLDPGSGSIMLQVLLSTVFATAYFFRGLFGRIGSWFRALIFGRSKSQEDSLGS